MFELSALTDQLLVSMSHSRVLALVNFNGCLSNASCWAKVLSRIVEERITLQCSWHVAIHLNAYRKDTTT